MTESWQHKFADANGIRIHYVEQGAGFPVILIHGFPEIWYSWRHQLPALAGAGYRAIAADRRGSGQSEGTPEIESYNMLNTTADVVGLLNALGEEKAIVVGHDWGAPIAWHCALLYPERFSAVVALSVPFRPRPPAPPIQMLKHIFANNFFYMLYFQEPGVAESELEADVRRSLRMFMYGASADAPPNLGLMSKPKDAKLLDGMADPEHLPDWLTEEDLDYYTAEFERTGFRAALNRYRNLDRDWEELANLANATIQQPALFIGGELDPVLRFAGPEGMESFAPNLRKEVIKDCGHWIQQEEPDQVNRILIDFFAGLGET